MSQQICFTSERPFIQFQSSPFSQFSHSECSITWKPFTPCSSICWRENNGNQLIFNVIQKTEMGEIRTHSSWTGTFSTFLHGVYALLSIQESPRKTKPTANIFNTLQDLKGFLKLKVPLLYSREKRKFYPSQFYYVLFYRYLKCLVFHFFDILKKISLLIVLSDS